MTNSDKERIASLETNHINIMQEMKEIKGDVKEILCKIENLNTKFAPKWVEQAMKVFIGTLCLAVIGAIIKVVLIS